MKRSYLRKYRMNILVGLLAIITLCSGYHVFKSLPIESLSYLKVLVFFTDSLIQVLGLES
jgi:hypothetical protein